VPINFFDDFTYVHEQNKKVRNYSTAAYQLIDNSPLCINL